MKSVFILANAIFMIGLISACAPAAAAVPTTTLTPTVAPTNTPVPSLSATRTPIPTPSTFALDGAGLTAGQRAYLEGPYGKNASAWLLSWQDFWASARETDQPVHDLTLTLIPDILDDRRWGLALESTDLPGVVVVPPTNTWGDLTLPPQAGLDHSIAAGEGPVFLSKVSTEQTFQETGIPVGSALATRDGRFVYMDNEGCVVGKTDKAGRWELAMRIDLEGRLHLGEHILVPLTFKQYKEGETIYKSPVINGIDIGYIVNMQDLGKYGRHNEFTYKVLNGSKGLDKFWKVDDFRVFFEKDGYVFSWNVVSSEDSERTKDPIDFFSVVAGVMGDVRRIEIVVGGETFVVQDAEDMHYLQKSP